MKRGRISDQLATDAVAALSDEVVFAVQEEEDMAREVAEVESLLEEIDRELAADARVERVRVVRDAPRARRARRRADRAVVRSLPVRLPVDAPLGGEAA